MEKGMTTLETLKQNILTGKSKSIFIHPVPHEHPCLPNPAGGTPKRGSPQPLQDWRY